MDDYTAARLREATARYRDLEARLKLAEAVCKAARSYRFIRDAGGGSSERWVKLCAALDAYLASKENDGG